MKICLAGTGAMGVIHAKALQKIEGVEVVSIASRTEESGRKFAEEYRIPFSSTSLDACIDRPGVDAVILTTPSDQHCDQTLLALAKGKHVQVEIPMALNLAGFRADAGGLDPGREDVDGHPYPPVFEPASRDQAANPRGDVPPASHGGRDLFLPPHQPEHARPAAVVGRQPAVASRLPFGRYRAVAAGRSRLGGVGPERPGSRRARHPDGSHGGDEVEGRAAVQHGDVVQQQGAVRRVLPLHRRRGHLQGLSRLDDRQRRQGGAARPDARVRSPGRRVRQRHPRRT